MGKYLDDATTLLAQVGGKKNVKAVTHCVTRMRFVLVDCKYATIEEIEKIPAVKGTFTQSGQFQVIIGNDVQEFYNEFMSVSGMDEFSRDDVHEEAKSNQTKLQKIMGNLGEIFAPLIPALICGGLILGFRNCIDSIKFFEDETKTLVEISQFFAGLDSFLWLIGEAVFHFLPIGIVWSITKKMGTNQILGIVLGITLVSPQLLNAYEVASTAPMDIPVWDFGIFQVEMIGYQAQVIPAMLAGFVLVYLEKFWQKHTHVSIQMIVVPFMSLVPAVIIAHTIVGPIGWVLGDFISNVIYGGLTSAFGWLFATLFGFLYAPLVITGLHHMSNAIDTQLVNTFGGTLLWPMIALSNIAQGSAVLAMIFLQKKNERAQQISIPACISCYLGVSEPALFGVNLKYMFPLICGMIASACAATFSVSTGTMAASIGVGGIPGILSILPQYMFNFLIAMIQAIVVSFTLTYAVGKVKLSDEDKYGEQIPHLEEPRNVYSATSFVSPCSGRIMPLNEVKDEVFASGMMGEGFAIELSDGEIVAPFDGEIILCFPSKHAYGIRDQKGVEVLIHIGMDTVELAGQGFQSCVEVGDQVRRGNKLAQVDLDYVKQCGKSLVSPIVFTSKQPVKLLSSGEVQKNQANIIAVGMEK